MRFFYATVKIFFRLALKVYFKKIAIDGIENVPRNQPVLFTPNHQNAFLDAFLVGAFSPVPLHFLTRSDVFKWWSKPILKSVNMIPIYRIRDGYSKLNENEAIFESCKNLFRNNKSILMFAEGNHGEHHYLRPLTKGAARLALTSQQVIANEIQIVPIGLNFFSHRKPASKVIIVFGKPIAVSDFVNRYQENSGKGLIEMRDAIASGMKSTLLIPDETSDYQKQKKFLFHSSHEKLTFQQLKVLTSNQNLEAEKSSSHLLAKIFNPVPYLLIAGILGKVQDVVFHSSIKFSAGLALFPLWWIFSFLFVQLYFGIIWAAIVVLCMILTLFIGYKWFRL